MTLRLKLLLILTSGEVNSQPYQNIRLPPRRKKNLDDLDKFLTNLDVVKEREVEIEDIPSPIINPVTRSSYGCIYNNLECKNSERCGMIMVEDKNATFSKEICMEDRRETMHPSFEETIFVTDHPRFPTIALKINEDLSIKSFGVIHSENVPHKKTLDGICNMNGHEKLLDVTLDSTKDPHCIIPLTYFVDGNELHEQLPLERWNKDQILRINCEKEDHKIPTAPWSSWSPWTSCKTNVASVRWRRCLGDQGEHCNRKQSKNQIQAATCFPYGRKRICGLNRVVPTIKVISSVAIVPYGKAVAAQTSDTTTVRLNTKTELEEASTAQTSSRSRTFTHSSVKGETVTMVSNHNITVIPTETTKTTRIKHSEKLDTTTDHIPKENDELLTNLPSKEAQTHVITVTTLSTNVNTDDWLVSKSSIEEKTTIDTTRHNTTKTPIYSSASTVTVRSFKPINGTDVTEVPMTKANVFSTLTNQLERNTKMSTVRRSKITTFTSELKTTITQPIRNNNEDIITNTVSSPVTIQRSTGQGITQTEHTPPRTTTTARSVIQTTTKRYVDEDSPRKNTTIMFTTRNTIVDKGIRRDQKVHLIQTTEHLNFVETLQWCNSQGSRLLENEELQFKKTNEDRKNRTSWFFVNARKVKQEWVWTESLIKVSLPKRRNSKLPNYESDEARVCLASNTRRVTEIPCLMKMRPICIKSNQGKKNEEMVIDTYFNTESEMEETNCQYNYATRIFKCRNWNSTTISKDLKHAKILQRRRIKLEDYQIPLHEDIKAIKEITFDEIEGEIISTLVYLPCINKRILAYEKAGKTQTAALIAMINIRTRCSFPLTIKRKMFTIEVLNLLKKRCDTVTCQDFAQRELIRLANAITIDGNKEILTLKKIIPVIMKKAWKQVPSRDKILLSMVDSSKVRLQNIDSETLKLINKNLRRHRGDSITTVAINTLRDIAKRQ